MKRLLKWLGIAVIGFASLVLIAALAVYFSSNAKVGKTFTVAVRPVSIPSGAGAIERGKHIAETRGCNDCHGKDYAGNRVIDDGAMGRLHGANLTRGKGGRVASFKDEDWVRAIRHGVGPDGRGLYLMPSEEYTHFSDEDLGVLVAFLKSLPAVDRERVPISLGPVSRVLLTLGKIKLAADVIDHASEQPKAVARTVSVEYGKYLANGCIGCHGPNLSGGKIEIGPPNWPQAANLTPHPGGRLAKWTEADFIATLRTAKRPDGSELDPVMPRLFAQMDDVELKALWAFLKTTPLVATGVR